MANYGLQPPEAGAWIGERASSMKIEGARVIVTGGASGIGRGLCERFASMGAAHVVVADLDAEAAETVAGQIDGTAISCDVSNDSSVKSLVEASVETMGGIDLFCANAGIGKGGGLDTSDELWDLSWRVNVMGPVIAARHVVPHLLANGGGGFFITASAVALITGPVSFNYATTKHAALGVGEWLAINHGPEIAVNVLCPTIVDTPMAVDFGPVPMPPLSVEEVVDHAVAGIEAGTFLICPTPSSLDMFRNKAQDYEGFLEAMQARVGRRQEGG